MLGQFSYANLELVKAEGFTRELGLDPRRLDDAAIESIRQSLQNAGIFVSSLDLGGNHIGPGPPSAKRRISTLWITELAGKLGVSSGLPIRGGFREPSKARGLRNKWMRSSAGIPGSTSGSGSI